eukprot:10361294-Heterocapsa_arctica.AAC.1
MLGSYAWRVVVCTNQCLEGRCCTNHCLKGLSQANDYLEWFAGPMTPWKVVAGHTLLGGLSGDP